MALANKATVTTVKSFLIQCPGTWLCSVNLFAGQKIIFGFNSTKNHFSAEMTGPPFRMKI
jgi:hypothetical protein